MKILIITQYFYPENFKVNDFAVGMKERGHEVVVLTGLPNYPQGRIYDGYGFFKRLEDEYEGIRVVRSWLLPRGNSSGWRLFINYISFPFLVSFRGLWKLRGKFDVIFVHEPSPIFIGIPALIMKWRFRAPVFLWILDLWPESLTAAGNINSSLLLKPVRWAVKFIYTYTDKLLMASKAFRTSIRSFGIADDKLEYFPNWAEGHLGYQAAADFEYRHLLPDGFKVMFAGNIGESQDFQSILAAAEKLKSHPDIKWVVIGDGRKAEWVRQEIGRRGLEQTFFLLGRFPAETMSSFFSHADAMLVTLKKEPIFELTVPAKLQAYMACGKLVLTMLDGEGSRIVEEAGAGLVCASGDFAGLAENVLEIYHKPARERDEFGKNALDYYRKVFDRDKLFDEIVGMFEKTINGN
ncbi:MAG: glycosyltransferase family 4 protein [Victivallaceae bacterium]|nr:glycosyltransferase family 4 protein [Victivallaceae bacterium]